MNHEKPSNFDIAFELDQHCGNLLKVQRRKAYGRGLGILDCGTGQKGFSRVILEHNIHPQDTLLLYDPYTDIREPRASTPNVRVIRSLEDPALQNEIDIVSLGFVLCCLGSEERKMLLTDLHNRFPRSALLVLEYVLGERNRQEALTIIENDIHRTNKPMTDKQLQSHTDSTLCSMTGMLEESGWQPDILIHLYKQKMCCLCHAAP